MQNNSLFRKTLMCLVMLLGMSVATANASTLLSVDEVQQGSYVTITGTGVRMRYGPGLNYGYYGTSPKKGTRLQLLGEDGDWYQVRYGQNVAYVFKQYAKLSGAPVYTSRVQITGVGVRLRMGPGLNYNYLKWKDGTARGPKKGDILECVGESGDWYKVRYGNGTYYVFKQYAKIVR